MDIKVKVCKIILLDTAALTSVSVMLLDHRNATTGGSRNNLGSVSLFSISFQWWRTMHDIFSKQEWYVRTRRTRLLIFFFFVFLGSPSSTVAQHKPCGDKRCKWCLQLQHAQVFHSKTTGKEYNILCNVNCKTPNVVYLLDCHVCGSQYVGESVQPFNKRMNGHRSDLTTKDALARESALCVAGALIGCIW
jgi:hypothetical protein